jgi:hypothetical protein
MVWGHMVAAALRSLVGASQRPPSGSPLDQLSGFKVQSFAVRDLRSFLAQYPDAITANTYLEMLSASSSYGHMMSKAFDTIEDLERRHPGAAVYFVIR